LPHPPQPPPQPPPPHEEPHALPHPDDELELALGNRAFMLGRGDGRAGIPQTPVSRARSCVSVPGTSERARSLRPAKSVRRSDSNASPAGGRSGGVSLKATHAKRPASKMRKRIFVRPRARATATLVSATAARTNTPEPNKVRRFALRTESGSKPRRTRFGSLSDAATFLSAASEKMLDAFSESRNFARSRRSIGLETVSTHDLSAACSWSSPCTSSNPRLTRFRVATRVASCGPPRR